MKYEYSLAFKPIAIRESAALIINSIHEVSVNQSTDQPITFRSSMTKAVHNCVPAVEFHYLLNNLFIDLFVSKLGRQCLSGIMLY